MTDHPQYAMWKGRYDAEQAAERERAARRADREAGREGWAAAWHSYQEHFNEVRPGMPLPHWWNLWAWAVVIFRARRRSV